MDHRTRVMLTGMHELGACLTKMGEIMVKCAVEAERTYSGGSEREYADTDDEESFLDHELAHEDMPVLRPITGGDASRDASEGAPAPRAGAGGAALGVPPRKKRRAADAHNDADAPGAAGKGEEEGETADQSWSGGKRVRVNWSKEEQRYFEDVIAKFDGETEAMLVPRIADALGGSRTLTQCKGHFRNLMSSGRLKFVTNTEPKRWVLKGKVSKERKGSKYPYIDSLRPKARGRPRKMGKGGTSTPAAGATAAAVKAGVSPDEAQRPGTASSVATSSAIAALAMAGLSDMPAKQAPAAAKSTPTEVMKSTPAAVKSTPTTVKSTATAVKSTVKSTTTAAKSTTTAAKSTTTTAKSTPAVAKSTPTAAKSTPTAAKSTPTAAKSTPTASKSTTTAVKSNPAAVKSNPAATKAIPTAPKSTPIAAKPTPIAAKPTPTAVASGPAVVASAPTATVTAAAIAPAKKAVGNGTMTGVIEEVAKVDSQPMASSTSVLPTSMSVPGAGVARSREELHVPPRKQLGKKPGNAVIAPSVELDVPKHLAARRRGRFYPRQTRGHPTRGQVEGPEPAQGWPTGQSQSQQEQT